MKYRMPDLTKIGGYNKPEFQPLIIEVEGKEKLINIAEKIIREMIKISSPPVAPISPKRINQLVCSPKKNGKIIFEPAYLVLTMKKRRISLNVTHWYNRGSGNRISPRHLEDIQCLKEPMEQIAREVADETREEATPWEVQEIVRELAMTAWQPKGM